MPQSSGAAAARTMYLISWIEEESILEASLGGRVTVEEMLVVYDELQELLTELDGQPYLFVLDYSKAKAFDHQAGSVVNDIKDLCRKEGAEKVVTVVRDADEVPLMTSFCLQNVLEGKEEFVTDPSVIHWTPTVALASEQRLAA